MRDATDMLIDRTVNTVIMDTLKTVGEQGLDDEIVEEIFLKLGLEFLNEVHSWKRAERKGV